MLLFSYLATNVQAVELGNLRVHSLLGRQLKASVPLTGDDARESEVRCFKAALVNLNREPVSTLRVTLQHFSNGSVLLLTGGAAIDEPAAMVTVENTCDGGSSREYALLLEPASSSTPATSAAAATPAAAVSTETVNNAATSTQVPATAKSTQAQRKTDSPEHAESLRERRKVLANPAFLYAIPGMPSMKMAAMLADPARDKMLQVAHAAPMPPDSNPHPSLRMDRTLASAGWTGLHGAETSLGLKAWIIGALSLFALLGAAAWIAMRVREMRAAARPWLPGETPADAGDGDGEARTATSS